jgi:hypothetical protein
MNAVGHIVDSTRRTRRALRRKTERKVKAMSSQRISSVFLLPSSLLPPPSSL